mgnify:CR=1 FL=1
MVSFISAGDLGGNADYKAYDSCADLICKYSNPKVLHSHMILCQQQDSDAKLMNLMSTCSENHAKDMATKNVHPSLINMAYEQCVSLTILDSCGANSGAASLMGAAVLATATLAIVVGN